MGKRKFKPPKIIGIEWVHDADIEDLVSDSLPMTIYRKLELPNVQDARSLMLRYGKKYTPDNLPNCDKCQVKNAECELTKICTILYKRRFPAYVILAKFQELGGNPDEIRSI